MQYEKTNSHHKYRFESLFDLYTWTSETPRKWNVTQSADIDASQSWDLGVGWDGAQQLAKAGWLDGASLVQGQVKAFKAPERAPDLQLAVAGTRPCIPAYLAGSPRNMWHRKEGTPNKPVVTLYVQVDGAGLLSAVHMANIGAAIAQYVKQMEAQGIQVEVWGVMSATSGATRVSFAWRVKRAGQPLDLPVLAFSIGHPAMLRRIGFAMLERCDSAPMPGYGGISDISEKDVIRPKAQGKYLNGMAKADRIARTPEDALAWLRNAVGE